ncbi:MAG TPA: uroporphyrinogen decarboxylase family protein [Anaerolineaceae bacterium]
MNSFERVMAVLNRQPYDRTPNFDISMAFGAHFIGAHLSTYFLDYRALVVSNLAVWQAFDLDIVQAISDPYREAVDFGLTVEFPEDGLPLCRAPLLVDADSLRILRAPDPALGRRMSDRLEGVQALRQHVGRDAPVMGWVEGALAEANVLRGVTALMLDFYDRPEWVEALLELTVGVEIAFARAQVAAGADLIGLGDAIASTLSPRLYEKFALPYEQRIFRAVHAMGALTRLHICGNTTHLLPLMVRSGADIIDIDWMVDIHRAASIFGDGPALCGNFDPVGVMLRGNQEEVTRSVLECQAAGGSRYFSAAGCEIPDGTPYANLLAQAQALKGMAHGFK